MTQLPPRSIPAHADIVVIGGGSARAVVAGRLAERSDRSVLLLEAGPDYGPYADGGWPTDLLDARHIPWLSHSCGRRPGPSTRFGRTTRRGCFNHADRPAREH